jgi:hypothetical protein
MPIGAAITAFDADGKPWVRVSYRRVRDDGTAGP